jgi:hypothetical protein
MRTIVALKAFVYSRTFGKRELLRRYDGEGGLASTAVWLDGIATRKIVTRVGLGGMQ